MACFGITFMVSHDLFSFTCKSDVCTLHGSPDRAVFLIPTTPLSMNTILNCLVDRSKKKLYLRNDTVYKHWTCTCCAAKDHTFQQ